MAQQFVLLKAADRSGLIRRISEFLALLPGDKAWKVEVCEHRRKRSDPQNRYLWGCVYSAFQSVLPGWDKEDIHEYLLGEAFGWERLEGMGRPRVKPVKRSSKLTTVEFSEYTEFCRRKGAEHGIDIGDPGEYGC